MLLSFIVPFYNVEKYISKCLDSLLDQDIPFADYEIICVNDCSPDNSRSIVIEYQSKYPNITLIEHTENRKLGAARNTGLNAAKGEYIWFVDSDDFIQHRCLHSIIKNVKHEKLDVLLFNYYRCDENGSITEKINFFKNTVVCNGANFVNDIYHGEFVYHFGYVWRMIYSLNFLKSINAKFPEGSFWEDTVFMPRTILLSNRIASLKEYYYNYRINASSIVQVTTRESRGDLLFQFAFNAGIELKEFSEELKTVNPEMSNVIYNRSCWYINSFTYRILRANNRQRIVFFKLISKNRNLINSVRAEMNVYSKIITSNWIIGLLISIILSPIYRLKNKLK